MGDTARITAVETKAPAPDPIERAARAAAAGAVDAGVEQLPKVIEALRGSTGPSDPVARLGVLLLAFGVAVAVVVHEVRGGSIGHRLTNMQRAIELQLDAQAEAHPDQASTFRAAERELNRDL